MWHGLNARFITVIVTGGGNCGSRGRGVSTGSA